MNKTHKGTRKGFTLLEILLVIAAIGILAAIVLVAINPTRQINQARQAAINSDKNTIEKALQQRLIDTGSYPVGLDGVQRRICSNGNTPPNCVDLSGLIPDYVAAIPSSTTYTVAKGNDGRVYVNTTNTAANFTCPTGYIKVPGNSLYQTKDFCVMKYEAKVGSSTVAATTQAAGTPQASISQIDAITACSLNGSGYGLINNREWMTIARNIEAQNSNWYNPTTTPPENKVGSGGLWRGHSDNATDLGESKALAAGADNNGYIGTGQSGFSIQRRTHTLSNGETIWDLSGNMWEWTNDRIMAVNKPTVGNDGEFTSITGYGSLSYDLIRPGNPVWNSSQNMGLYFVGGLTGGPFAFLRGGDWNYTNFAGVFTLDLNATPSSSATRFGFRCVLR